MAKLRKAWDARNVAVFERSVGLVAAYLGRAATERATLASKRPSKEEKEQGMKVLARRLASSSTDLMEALLLAHGLEGKAAEEIDRQLEYAIEGEEPLDAERGALWGGLLSGAVGGLTADLLAGGLTFGGGLLAGAILGALGGAGLARGMQLVRGDRLPQVAWTPPFLDPAAQADAAALPRRGPLRTRTRRVSPSRGFGVLGRPGRRRAAGVPVGVAGPVGGPGQGRSRRGQRHSTDRIPAASQLALRADSGLSRGPRTIGPLIPPRGRAAMIRYYQVDAFTDRPFAGNPANVVPLEAEAPTEWMQSLAEEFNLSETAFLLPEGDGRWHLRWFTPAIEVPLCGHATLASAHVLFETGAATDEARFRTQSGELIVRRATCSGSSADGYSMDFPALPPEPWQPPDSALAALGIEDPVAVAASFHHPEDWYVVVEVDDADAVRAVSPDMRALAREKGGGWIVTARADQRARDEFGDVDFVSRFFAPDMGVDEDPVTGSAHCVLHAVLGRASRARRADRRADFRARRRGALSTRR